MLLSAQIKAGRGLIKMSQIELALITGLSIGTIKKLENDEEALENANSKTIRKIRKALEEKGVKFLPPKEEGSLHGAGVIYINPQIKE